jgi:hypothetical protein
MIVFNGVDAPPGIIVFNGVDADSGQYVVAPQTIADIHARLRDAYNRRVLAPPVATGPLAIPDDLSPTATGWAIVHHADDRTPVLRIEELRSHRERTGVPVRVLDYHGEPRTEWVRRHEGVPGLPSANNVPYYLLVVGVPDRIPFSFVQELAADHAVGFLGFEALDDYTAYAGSVVRAEQARELATRRGVAFWAPAHDAATQLSHRYLVPPLIEVAAQCGFEPSELLGEAARKDRFRELVEHAPAVLFTASHGVAYPAGDARQLPAQGALLGAEWTGGPVRAEHVIAACDLDDVDLEGSVAFCFGCHTAGTPTEDRLATLFSTPQRIAPRAFASALSHQLLRRGALAFVGHLDRTLSSSFMTDQRPTPHVFRETLRRLLGGAPLGHAMRFFASVTNSLTRGVAPLCERLYRGLLVDPSELVPDWLRRADAEGFVLIGDPATRLRVDLLQ